VLSLSPLMIATVTPFPVSPLLFAYSADRSWLGVYPHGAQVSGRP
jgi:hypothetical protein